MDELPEIETISWATFHSNRHPASIVDENSVAIFSLLQLFYDSAHSEAMIQHSVDVVKMADDVLSPEQVPIITLDRMQ